MRITLIFTYNACREDHVGRYFDLPYSWLHKVPEQGFLELVFFTCARTASVELRQSLMERVLVSEEMTTTQRALHAKRRRDGMLREIFEKFDTGKTGFLDAASFREYLKATKAWGTGYPWRNCTDENYETKGWPEQCKRLECDPAVGISLVGFDMLYTKPNRESKTQSLLRLGKSRPPPSKDVPGEEDRVVVDHFAFCRRDGMLRDM